MKNQSARQAITCVKASFGSVDLRLFKKRSQGVRQGHNIGSNFYIGVY